MPSDADHDEFMQLFLEHQPRIYGYIRSLVFQRADADDIMQETASVLWKKFGEFERGTHFDRWALRVAWNQVRFFRQKKARESQKLQFSDEVCELLKIEAEPLVDSTEEVAGALELCLRKLSARDRQVVAWRFEPEATNRSVAERLGKSDSAISRQLTRIYTALMRCISLQLKLEEPAG